ncbi:MAG: hypothetical protein ACK4MQ_13250 [Hyphomonas sp.]
MQKYSGEMGVVSDPVVTNTARLSNAYFRLIGGGVAFLLAGWILTQHGMDGLLLMSISLIGALLYAIAALFFLSDKTAAIQDYTANLTARKLEY